MALTPSLSPSRSLRGLRCRPGQAWRRRARQPRRRPSLPRSRRLRRPTSAARLAQVCHLDRSLVRPVQPASRGRRRPASLRRRTARGPAH
eukprot:13970488-Alexandrium_andersonii.AAC.1